MLSSPARELPAALASVVVLSPADVTARLEKRADPRDLLAADRAAMNVDQGDRRKGSPGE
jgi:hypothetical protein